MATFQTTHTGSLPRPPELTELLIELEAGEMPPSLPQATARAVEDVVAHQLDIGIDLISDGEQGKTGYSTYVRERLGGFEGELTTRPPSNDLAGHEDFVQLSVRLRGRPSPRLPACNGPIAYVNRTSVHVDTRNLLSAGKAAGVGPDRLFMTAASPGLIGMFFENRYYASRSDYLNAIGEAMRYEYQAIVEAGFILQLDCPDFAMSHNSVFQDLTLDEFRREVEISVEALNAATEGLPAERMRYHICWGNYESPHTTDVPLASLIDVVTRARPAGIVIEAANPRHAHEWTVFENFELPEDKYLVVGVIDTTTNFVEHPELVAQRIEQYAKVVGPSRVMAGTDCGFGTFIGRDRVAPSVVWSKLAALSEGARLASARFPK